MLPEPPELKVVVGLGSEGDEMAEKLD